MLRYILHNNREGRPIYITLILLYGVYNIDYNHDFFYEWQIINSIILNLFICLVFYLFDQRQW